MMVAMFDAVTFLLTFLKTKKNKTTISVPRAYLKKTAYLLQPYRLYNNRSIFHR